MTANNYSLAEIILGTRTIAILKGEISPDSENVVEFKPAFGWKPEQSQ